MRKLAVLVLMFLTLAISGCATTQPANEIDQNYLAYLTAMKEKPMIEIEAVEGQSLTITGLKKLTVYGHGGGRSEIQPFQPPLSAGAIFAREFGATLRTVAPFAFGAYISKQLFDFASDAVDNAGHNISGSYNTNNNTNMDSHDISGSYNLDDHSIRDSYNDRHDVYSPIDNHSVNTTNNGALPLP